jgi:hypothetical protein
MAVVNHLFTFAAINRSLGRETRPIRVQDGAPKH